MARKVNPVRIRAHTLLCLQGYKGLGYSPEFADRMDKITGQLKRNPNHEVQVICSPDIFCEVCPNLVDQQCVAGKSDVPELLAGGEDNSTIMDRKVLGKLCLSENEIRAWSDILKIIGQNISSRDMDDICGDCRWREFKYCAQALDSLHYSTRL
jgi:hypothetical protein